MDAWRDVVLVDGDLIPGEAEENPRPVSAGRAARDEAPIPP
jgi:hypothetical protein